MMPVIFDANATDFTTQGLGPLHCIECTVEEEHNGIYELTLTISSSSPRVEYLVQDNIIVATHSSKGDRQPFQIYGVEKNIDGIITVYAEHISYRLNKIVAMPFEVSGIKNALNGLKNNAVSDCPFFFSTDKESNITFKQKVPKSIKASLFGSEGSIIDTFSSGDYEFDGFSVKLWENRGEDNGITVRYGKNLTDLKSNTDISDIYTAIVPYWSGRDEDDENDVLVTLSTIPEENIVESGYASEFPRPRIKAVDLSEKFEEQPSPDQLRAAAITYLNENARRQLVNTIQASVIELSQTDQFKDVYALEKINLCDTVTVIHESLGISDQFRVTNIVYDVLAERNKTIRLGDQKKTLSQIFSSVAKIPTSGTSISAAKKNIEKKMSDLTDTLESRIEEAEKRTSQAVSGLIIVEEKKYDNLTGISANGFDNWYFISDNVDIDGYIPVGIVGFAAFPVQRGNLGLTWPLQITRFSVNPSKRLHVDFRLLEPLPEYDLTVTCSVWVLYVKK